MLQQKIFGGVRNLEMILYDKKFSISEKNICEGRAKFLVRDLTKNTLQTVKQKCLQCHSFAEMSKKIPKIAGYLMMNTTKNLIYILHREGVKTNAKIFLDSVFQKYQPVCYKVSKIILQDYKSLGLKNKDDIKGAAEVFANAVVIDLNNLWYGYFRAHSYKNYPEFYTLQKFLDAKESLKKITFYTDKNIVRETYVNALKNVPYDMEIYNQAKILLGEDKNLEKYKSLFTQDFKKNSYKNFDEQNEKTKLVSDMVNILNNKVAKKKVSTTEITTGIYDEFLRHLNKNYGNKFSCNVYIFGYNEMKSKTKFENAMNAYAKIFDDDEKPIICYDSTIFGSATEGFVLTTHGMYLKNIFQDKKFFNWKKNPIIELNNNKIFINNIEILTSSPKKEVSILFEMIKEIRDKMIQYL